MRTGAGEAANAAGEADEAGDCSPDATTSRSWKSEGQRRLCTLTHSGAEVGRAIGASSKVVSSWRRGVKCPAADAQRALEKAFSIPVGAWVQQPSTTPPRPARTAARRAQSDLPPVVEGIDQATTVAKVDDLLAAIRITRADAKLTAGERLKAAAEERALLSLRARVQRQAALDSATIEDALCRSPRWIGLRTALIEALRPHPVALAAVRAALTAGGYAP